MLTACWELLEKNGGAWGGVAEQVVIAPLLEPDRHRPNSSSATFKLCNPGRVPQFLCSPIIKFIQ